MALLTQDPNTDEDAAKEIAQLEDDFARPAYTRPEDQEQKALDDTVGEEAADDDDEGSWTTSIKGKTKGKSKKSRKKLIIGAGVGGGISLILVGLFLIMMFLGQLKAIHFATVLRSTGFATSQLMMRKTFSQIALNATATPDSTGPVNSYERSMFDRLRGINPDKTMKILNRQGKWAIVTDKGKAIGFELNGKRYLNDDFAKQAFPDSEGGYDGLSRRQQWTVKNAMNETVYRDFSPTLSAESRTFNNSFFKGFREHFNIKGGKWSQKARELAGKSSTEALEETRRSTTEAITDGDRPTSSLPEVEEAARAADDAIEESLVGLDADGNPTSRGRLSDWVDKGYAKAGIQDTAAFSETMGKVSIGVFAVTMFCTARDIQNSLEEINVNKETQAQRYSHDVQTTSDQIKSGDVNSEAVNAANAMWDGSEGIPPADASPLYQESIGKSMSGNEVDSLLDNSPTAKIADTPLKTVVEGAEKLIFPPGELLPGVTAELKDSALSAGCGTVLNPAVQGVIAGVDVAVSVTLAISTGSASEVAKAGLRIAIVSAIGIYGGNTLGEWLETAVSNFAGAGFTGAETGVDRYNAAAISTDYMNASVNRGVAYGRPLSKDEALSSRKVALAELKETEASKSLTHRYFAIDNPYSLTGSFAATAPTNVNGFALKTRDAVAGAGTKLSSLLNGSLGVGLVMDLGGTQQKVSAAAYNNVMAEKNFFGVDQWGWTPQELYKIEQGNDTFDVVTNAGWVGERNIGGKLDQKYAKCYEPAAQTSVPEEGCDAGTLGSDEAIHWRLFKLHESVIDQINDTTITEDQGSSGGSESSLTGGTLGPDLPSGTEEELIREIKDTGNILSGADLLSTNMKRTILAVILKLSQKYKFTINSTIRFGAGPHGNGSAVDIGNINAAGVPTGQDYAAFNEDANQFVADAATLLPGNSWFGVSNDKFKATANPIMNPKGGSADLDIPSTTGATGAHFHLNVPAAAE